MVTSISQAPWTVLSQGSQMNYTDADVLDKFEYSVNNGSDVGGRLQPGQIEELSSAVFAALNNISNADALKRASAMLVKILTFDRTKPDAVLACMGAKIFEPLVKNLGPNVNITVSCAVATSLSILLCCPKIVDLEPADLVSTNANALIAWLCEKFSDPKLQPTDMVGILQALGYYLRTERNRMVFLEDSKRASILGSLMEKERHSQVQVIYHTGFNFWLLSFVSTAEDAVKGAAAMNEAEVPRRMTNVLREVAAEKVVRITLAALRNFADPKFGSMRREMIGAGLVGALEQLCLRRWNDGDIRDDLAALTELLQEELQVMSTFDVYKSEILSGALTWSPVHKDEMFWRDNADKMERNNLELLRCLAKILHESSDPTILSVACHDIGLFIKYHERGRHLIQTLGVKPRLMELMISEDADVRRQALTCVQILMISHYELMPGARK